MPDELVVERILVVTAHPDDDGSYAEAFQRIETR
jgi:hypothetical protein